ncbi:hypothetical protein [Victivallis vadensis]|uniref:hypothetical protein n=1 Tax=Victivallis vadensis TaxID=172901 RepID=UPI003D0867A0
MDADEKRMELFKLAATLAQKNSSPERDWMLDVPQYYRDLKTAYENIQENETLSGSRAVLA